MDIDGVSPADQTNEIASGGNESSPSSEGEQRIGFADMDLSSDMRRSLERAGYEEPSPVQAGVIPPALDGHDVMGQAQTGTGKTAAFVIPMLQNLNKSSIYNQVFALSLHLQDYENIGSLMKTYRLHIHKHLSFFVVHLRLHMYRHHHS